MSGYTWKELATDKADESRVWIDDILLQEEFGVDVKLSSLEPMTPDLRNQPVVIPGRAGAYDMGAELEPRVFQLDCVFPRQSYSDLKSESRRLTALFFDQFGKPREVMMRMGDEPEKWYTVRVTEGITPSRVAHRGIFSAVLTAFDPYAYAPATYYDPDFIAIYNTAVQYDDGVTEYTNQTHTPFINARQYAGVFNYSHYATPFSFMIEGYVRNPKITNLTSGKSAQINVTVKENERLYFDSRSQTTWKVSGEDDQYAWLTPAFFMKDYARWDKLNRYNDMRGSFIDLLSGGNSFLFEGEMPDANIYFEWKHRFL